jgi:preprotein translocase subunit SecG
MLSLIITFLLAIHVVVSLLIILLVLMQRPKSEGLGAAFGGGMTENLFGAQTTNVLASATRWLGGTFFVLTLILSILYAKQSTQHSTIQQNLLKQAAAAMAHPTVAPAAGAGGLTGTNALPSSTSFGNTDLSLGASASGTAGSLLPAPTLAATPAATGTAGH